MRRWIFFAVILWGLVANADCPPDRCKYKPWSQSNETLKIAAGKEHYILLSNESRLTSGPPKFIIDNIHISMRALMATPGASKVTIELVSAGQKQATASASGKQPTVSANDKQPTRRPLVAQYIKKVAAGEVATVTYSSGPGISHENRFCLVLTTEFDADVIALVEGWVAEGSASTIPAACVLTEPAT
ncbi:hypothetical protein [Stigmatella aurantiaca]|uniref:Uncharacterized protein n=1 Tax=Stigmatella aurantiaca (strain DW4/3-1) TaxID=378806 RepID=E3FHU8_STIAD|nr:hypothetical protein [Stigmatella aurantiaca]ADO70370.1 uncharacterized protein STAUR_2566 [Stigmatella aurantiaca DW4/3-1]